MTHTRAFIINAIAIVLLAGCQSAPTLRWPDLDVRVSLRDGGNDAAAQPDSLPIPLPLPTQSQTVTVGGYGK